MMVILEYCGGGNLHKALQKDAKTVERRLVRPFLFVSREGLVPAVKPAYILRTVAY
jgi:hypothetical protein